MAFKDVLLVISTYPDPTPVGAIDEAVDIAAALGARISAIACELKFKVPGNIFGKVLVDVPAMAATEAGKSARNAEALLAAFQESAEKRGIFQDGVLERCLTTEAPDLLVEYSRLRDLTIVPVAEEPGSVAWQAEAIIFGSGRPVMVIPEVRKRARAFSLDTVVVAWDFSRPAARAVGDALSILERAKRVHVVTVTNEKIIDTRRSGHELAKLLARHGVNVVLDTVDAAGRDIGTTLESYVAMQNADLLVMGAYGHSRLRDFVLGGATRSMIRKPPVPIFLSH